MKIINQIIQWTLPIALGISIVCFAVLFTLSFKGLYHWEIGHLSIAEDSQIEREVIKENYEVLITYLTDANVEKLNLPSFEMSKEGEIHFEDVKKIFTSLRTALYILGIYSIFGILFNLFKKQYAFLQATVIGIFSVTLTILLAAMINFDRAFVFFHKISFTNDYWIFDPELDPVITILPQEFFMHSFILIIGLVFLMSLILMLTYYFLNSKYKKHR